MASFYTVHCNFKCSANMYLFGVKLQLVAKFWISCCIRLCQRTQHKRRVPHFLTRQRATLTLEDPGANAIEAARNSLVGV
jgi:hypothetical protein